MPVVNGKTVQISACAAGVAGRQGSGTAVSDKSDKSEADNLMAIVARYQGPLLRYVGRMLGSADDQGQDVVQETFIRLHRQVAAHGWDSIKHLTTWLFRVAHNQTMDVLRRRARRPDTSETSADPAVTAEEHAVQEMDALGEVIRQEARQAVLRELAKLDDSYRQVLLLKIVQGMTLREVAEVAGVSLSTVNYRLNEGLGILARRLRKAGVV